MCLTGKNLLSLVFLICSVFIALFTQMAHPLLTELYQNNFTDLRRGTQERN